MFTARCYESLMGDLALSGDVEPTLDLEDYRLLRLVAKARGTFIKLPLRYKFDHSVPDRLVERRYIQRGDSGWPGVPGYRILDTGVAALEGWLMQRRMPPA